MLCSPHYFPPGQDTSQCSMFIMWSEIQASYFVARAARNGQLQFPVIQFSLRVFSSAAISASDSWRSSRPASLPRDQSVTAQPISIRKAQSRKKSPQTFAHLMNFSNSCVGHLNVSIILFWMKKPFTLSTCLICPQNNKARKSDHVGGSCTWSRATRGQSHAAEILSRSVEMPSLLTSTPLEQAALSWI